MNKFWDLFKTSVVLQFTLAVVITLTICALYLLGRDVPTELTGAWLVVLGFIFGQKTQQTIDRHNS